MSLPEAKGRFIAVVGPAGVGKESLMKAMAAADPRLRVARRVITRANGQQNETFDCATREDFKQMERGREFALSWGAQGHSYGIPAAPVDAELEAGRDVLANVSRGVLGMADNRFERFMVLSLTAKKDVLAARLKARGGEDDNDIAARLARASYRVPEGLEVVAIDNSAELKDTVVRALNALYPVSA